MIDKGQRIQAIAIPAFGGPDQLKLVDLPVPPCGPEQVLISVQGIVNSRTIVAFIARNSGEKWAPPKIFSEESPLKDLT
ncbi:hypothetical protein [Ktedonobacter robiniae]|uniref:Uncharacterized protein n=1 Tax=Ktedonobacter robiniae TaxID=2778365 RepID=A0ABQ3V6E7_9CHLR|nr:hypothetical protein [Ktedonobacter robiniae]GHO60547.1 hypothetical protein KSB_90220 [Ktedonobacter robiniae]